MSGDILPAARGGRRLVVDWPRCKGHGVCAEVLPEVISLDRWHYPVVADGPVPASLAGHARRAVTSCPEVALRLLPAPDRPTG